MDQLDPFKHLEPLLKRMDLLVRSAAELSADAPQNARLCLIADLEAGRRAARNARNDLQTRLGRALHTRTATHAYGRAHMLRAPHR